MQIMFRQGIVNYPRSDSHQRFLTKNGSNVSLSVDNSNVLTYTIAHRDTNYLFSETVPVNNAWTNVDANQRYWLYIDIDPVTGLRTFGKTTRYPIVSAVEPQHLEDQMWFNTSTYVHYVSHNFQWKEVIRVFVCVIEINQILPFNANAGSSFAGTQIGEVGNVQSSAGHLIFDNSGLLIHRSTGEMFTTVN